MYSWRKKMIATHMLSSALESIDRAHASKALSYGLHLNYNLREVHFVLLLW